MKFIWEAKDISCGRIVCKPTHQFSDRKNAVERGFKPDGWTSKWTFKIGWLAGGNPAQEDYYELPREEREGKRKDYCLMCMTDGMISVPHTKQEIADWLNTEEMIPMPHDWFVATVDYLRTINERGNG